MKKQIKWFFKHLLKLLWALLLGAADLVVYICAVIAIYRDDYFIALILMVFGIAMEIKKGFKKNLEISKDEIAFSVVKQLRKEIISKIKGTKK